jgi:putative ABC transport system ATP-binding protein
MLQISSLVQRYGPAQIRFPDWNAEKGEHWLLSGKSGSGKTTLLHIICGLIKPSEGEVYISGKKITEMNSTDADQFRGNNIGIIFQKAHLISSLSVIENLLAAQYFSSGASDVKEAENLLGQLGIADKRNQLPHTLSQGEAQRAVIARAVINNPAMIVADEPTSSLDDESCDMVISLLKNTAQKQNALLIVSTHDGRLKPYFHKTYSLSAP